VLLALADLHASSDAVRPGALHSWRDRQIGTQQRVECAARTVLANERERRARLAQLRGSGGGGRGDGSGGHAAQHSTCARFGVFNEPHDVLNVAMTYARERLSQREEPTSGVLNCCIHTQCE